jgi:hypothetical protein
MAQKLDLSPILGSMTEEQRAEFMTQFNGKKKKGLGADKKNFKIAMEIADSMGVSPGVPGEDSGALKTEDGPSAVSAVPVATAGAGAAYGSAGPQQVVTSVQANYTLAGILAIVAVVLLVAVLLIQWQEWTFYLDAWPRSLFR